MKKANPIKYYSAPGRVCLYGEHQDYLNLTVVPAAIDLRTMIGVRRNSLNKMRIKSLDTNTTDEYTFQKKLKLTGKELDYLRAILIILQKKGLIEKISGLDVEIESKVPIGSGLSSSAALLVAWLSALNGEFDLSLSQEEIADFCFQAENQILGINCGIMDQYSSSLGGIFSLDCDGPPYKIDRFDIIFHKIVIGDSLVRRSANEPLTILKNQLFSGIQKVRKETEISIKALSIDNLDNLKAKLTKQEYIRLLGAIRIRDITIEACKELSKYDNHDYKYLGDLLTEQQIMLRDKLEVSIPELDKLITASLENGAIGAKLTGAGYGGCIIAYAPTKEKEVAKAIEKAGGKAIICNVESIGGKKH